VQFIAHTVYPEDPELAEKFIDRNKLTTEVLDNAEQILGYRDTNAVCCELFDATYREAA